MSNVKSIQSSLGAPAEALVTAIATLHEVSSAGIPMIEIAGYDDGALLEADVGIGSSDMAQLTSLPAKVVIVYSSSMDSRPVITSLVRATFSKEELDALNPHSTSRDLIVEGRKVHISGKEDVLFECGKSSILLRRDGKIVIKGAQIVSRASGANKLKGSSVNIN